MTEYFDTPDKLYLVLDYVEGGELFDRIVDEVSASALRDRVSRVSGRSLLPVRPVLRADMELATLSCAGKLHGAGCEPNHAPNDRGHPIPPFPQHCPP